MKSKNFSAAILSAAIILSLAGKIFACGPDFPNNLLDAGDHAVLQPPIADFQRELARMKLVTTSARAVPLVNGQKYYEQSADADVADLADALKRNKISSEQATAIITFHLAQRAALNSFLTTRHAWDFSGDRYYDTQGGLHSERTNLPPTFPEIQIAPGLPLEFALYFKGYCAWQNDEEWKAQEFWQQVLELPAGKRHYKSIWAAFMLGKFHAATTNDYEDAEALKYFEQVRDLAKNGFADSLGLVTASVGLEAQVYLRQQNYEHAIELYLEQFAAGDDSAVASLCTTASRVLGENGATPAQLSALAKNLQTRRLITAYLISKRSYYNLDSGRAKWLAAVENAGVRDVDSAEQLALAAYQADDMDAAQRWIKLAANRPVAQWLQAKLLMRDGKVDAAARLLARLIRKFPATNSDTNIPASLAGNLFVTVSYMWDEQITAGQQVLGELGTLRLARREYTESLDALLRSGYWMDAAYVAERVLTTDELKTYVDRNWPAIPASKPADGGRDVWSINLVTTNPGRVIRYLLARRLAREANYVAARKYFPADLQTNLGVFTIGLRDGANEKLSDLQRGRALFASACMARTNGMELFGTELEPDWAIYGGEFTFDATWQARTTNALVDKINISSADELARASLRHVEPEQRFHYRWQAADLAWAAAKFMPDNLPETAEMLCRGGAWIKNSDPKKADVFYKSLVRRCRQTAIGMEADAIRWFPLLDENGNVLSQRLLLLKLTPEITNAISRDANGEVFSGEFPVPGTKYVVHRGDTLAGITAAAGRMDDQITLEKVLLANPGLDPIRIRPNQLITIPSGKTKDNSDGKSSDWSLPISGTNYVIQAGDTVAKIAAKAQLTNPAITVEKLKEANPEMDSTRIKVGQVLIIPKP